MAKGYPHSSFVPLRPGNREAGGVAFSKGLGISFPETPAPALCIRPPVPIAARTLLHFFSGTMPAGFPVGAEVQ